MTIDERTDPEQITALAAAGETITIAEETSLTWHFARPNAITITPDGRRTAGLDRNKPAAAAAA